MKIRTRREHVLSVQLQRMKRWTQIARKLDKAMNDGYTNRFAAAHHWKLNQYNIPVPCSFGEWAVWVEQRKNVVRRDVVDGYLVSTVFLPTVFLPMDAGFESMTFAPPGDDDFEQAQQRYMTYAEAIAGHEQLLQMIKFQLTIAKKTILLLPPPSSTQENPAP
jgi:hypothetical protein